jgi:ATP phosphoribosyltransferase
MGGFGAMSAPLLMAIPSKGRLKDQAEEWLADCGLSLSFASGERGYLASIEGLDDIQVRLASAADIAAALMAGDIHLGVTGEDLLREFGAAVGQKAMLLLPLGFGRADLVVASPRSWLDVETMADLDDVARLYLARTGGRLRVATKYRSQTRTFFAQHAIADYRIVDSAGATEGAPAAGASELVVDITSSGATLLANGLKPLSDGLILKSQAQLAGSLAAQWDLSQKTGARALIRILEARAKGQSHAFVVWPSAQEQAARQAIAPFAGPGGEAETGGALVPVSDLFAAIAALTGAAIGPVNVSRHAYVFEASSAAGDRLEAAINSRDSL